MNRLGNKVVSSSLALVASASLLAGCGGGGSRSAVPAAPAATTAPAEYTGPLVNATLRISIPGPNSSAFKRRPSYVSSATKSLKFTLNSSTTVSGTATAGTLGTYNTKAWSSFNVGTLGSAPCPNDPNHAGNYLCTVTLPLPPGSDNITISARDNTGGAGNILSQAIATFVVTTGGSGGTGNANDFGVTLDANAATIAVSGTQPCTSGSIAENSSFGSVGTSTVTFNVSYTDAQSKTVVAPGLPLLTVNGYTDSNPSNGNNGYTIGTLPNQATLKVTQSTQSFTVTPNTVPISGVALTVNGSPPTTDGLTFSQTRHFTFSAGTAPSGSFLGVVEQNGSSSQIQFWNVGLNPWSSSTSDTFTPFAASGPGGTLATTSSINQGKPDVDQPQDLAFDSQGNLLIANAGSGGGDAGNFACVPVGAISTGAATSTTATSDLDTPSSIAVGSDNSVALANRRAGAAKKLVEFTLTPNYTEKSTVGDTLSDAPHGVWNVINLPSLSPGTYAVALVGNSGASGAIQLLDANGNTSSISTTQDSHLVDPRGLGWNPASAKLVAANQNTTANSYLEFFNVFQPTANPTLSASFLMLPDPNNPGSGQFQADANGGNAVAVAPNTGTKAGWIAVAGDHNFNSVPGGPEIRFWDQSGSPVGVIPFDQEADNTHCNGGGTYYYTGTNQMPSISFIKFLTNTKLLVGLISVDSGGNATSHQGLYIFDLQFLGTPPGYWCTYPGQPPAVTPASGPSQSGFVHLTVRPFAGAYKP